MIKRKLLALLPLLLLALSTQAQLLWKVEGNGLKAPSYIMGTHHLAKVSFADSITGLKNALNACEQVYGEVDMQKMMTDPQVAMSMQAAMQLPQGQTIDQVLDAAQMERLNAFMKKYMGADLTHPALASMKQLTPTAITTQLTVLLALQIEKGFNPQEQFDTYFQKHAQENNKRVGGLETIEFQMKVLFLSTPIKRQVEQLMCFVDHADYQRTMLEQLSKAFYSQNLEEIQKLTEEKREEACNYTPEEENALIYDRNANWAKALPAIMKAHSTFVAVGAAHLPGNKGVLQLLKEQGFSVTPVK